MDLTLKGWIPFTCTTTLNFYFARYIWSRVTVYFYSIVLRNYYLIYSPCCTVYRITCLIIVQFFATFKNFSLFFCRAHSLISWFCFPQTIQGPSVWISRLGFGCDYKFDIQSSADPYFIDVSDFTVTSYSTIDCLSATFHNYSLCGKSSFFSTNDTFFQYQMILQFKEL